MAGAGSVSWQEREGGVERIEGGNERDTIVITLLHRYTIPA